MSPSRKTVAPMAEKIGWEGLPLLGARSPAMVTASEEALGGVVGRGDSGKVTCSGRKPPGPVKPSEPSAGLGVAAELSPLETAIPSCALRDPRSASSGIFPTMSLISLIGWQIEPPQSGMV